MGVPINGRKINGFSWSYFIPHSDRRTLPRSALRPKLFQRGGCRFSWRSGVFLGGEKATRCLFGLWKSTCYGKFVVVLGELMMIKTYFNEIQATCCGMYPKIGGSVLHPDQPGKVSTCRMECQKGIFLSDVRQMRGALPLPAVCLTHSHSP